VAKLAFSCLKGKAERKPLALFLSWLYVIPETKGIFMAMTEAKKMASNAGMNLPTRPKGAKSTESQYSYYARKYMEAQAARSALKEDN
tara:strand:+ start:157 stop:420 length:264 start_codon:yes stop_codon:yes gene_type:complete